MVNRENTGVKDAISNEEITYMDYRGFKNHKPIEVPITLVKMPRFQGSQTTIFPRNFPVLIVCSEFCGKSKACHLRENGFGDLCQHHGKFGKLVHRVNAKWSIWFNKKMDAELKAKMQFAKSSIRGIIPEIALAHERTEDKTFAAYSSMDFLDTWDDPGEDELGYSMDTGMVSSEKSQAGAIHPFMYATVYKDRRMLMGFETRRVMKFYTAIERVWFMQDVRIAFAEIETPRVAEYTENTPVYKWVRVPTLVPIGCYLKAPKVVGSTTIVTRKERKFYDDRREIERQKHHHLGVRIAQDEIDARKQVATATC